MSRRKLKMGTEEEPIRLLHEKLWRARGRRSRMTGAALLIVSGVFLFLAYFTRYIVFEVTSVLALFLGVIFVLIGVEPYVKMSVANRAMISSLVFLGSLLSYLKVNGKAIYIPATSARSSDKIFVPTHNRSSLPSFEEITKENDVIVLDKGVLLPSVGNALLQLYEEELGDLRNIDLDYLMDWLPRVLVDGLKVAEGMRMTQKEEEIYVELTASASRYLCQRMESVKVVCETIGCPLCGSIGEAIAKTTGRIVYYLKCGYDSTSRGTSILYRLGPSLETLRQGERKEKKRRKEG